MYDFLYGVFHNIKKQGDRQNNTSHHGVCMPLVQLVHACTGKTTLMLGIGWYSLLRCMLSLSCHGYILRTHTWWNNAQPLYQLVIHQGLVTGNLPTCYAGP